MNKGHKKTLCKVLSLIMFENNVTLPSNFSCIIMSSSYHFHILSLMSLWKRYCIEFASNVMIMALAYRKWQRVARPMKMWMTWWGFHPPTQSKHVIEFSNNLNGRHWAIFLVVFLFILRKVKRGVQSFALNDQSKWNHTIEFYFMVMGEHYIQIIVKKSLKGHIYFDALKVIFFLQTVLLFEFSWDRTILFPLTV